MKPRSLHLEHFGPYTDHVVDFEPLLSEGLFLIHGDTGAGKSTLLDAISYALFGRGLGLREGEEHLRNKTALPEQVTAVSLEFTLGDARYRVRRSMPHDRPARRGGALTRQPAEALIECASGDPGFATVTSPTKVTEAVERLLKLEHPQFSRIIVLPQGEFRELLLSRAKEREALLEQIFGSELYKAVELALHEMDKQAERAVQALGDQTASLLGSVGAPDREALAAMRDGADAEVAREGAAVASLAASLVGSLDALEQCRNAHARNARRRALDGREAALASAGAVVKAQRAQAEAAERAGGCAVALQERARTERQRATAVEAAATARVALEEARAGERDPQWGAARGEGLAAERRRWSDARTELEARSVDARRMADEAALLAEATRAEAAAQRAFDEAAARAEAAAVARREAGEAAARWAAKAADEPTALMRRAEVSRRLEALQRREALAARRVELDRSQRDLERRARAADARLEQARAERDELRTRQRATMAALLAEGLADGTPCPVCGSEAHPKRATRAAAAVEQEALAGAEGRFDQCEAAAREARQRHTLELGELAGAQAQLLEAERDDGATELEASAAERVARAAVQEAQRARGERESAERRCAALDQELSAAQRARGEREQAVAAARARAEALRERMGAGAAGGADAAGAAEAALAALREADAALAKTEAALAAWTEAQARIGLRRVAAEERSAEAERALSEATGAAARAASEAAEVLARQGFSSAAEAEGQWVEPAALRALWQRVQQHEAAREAAEAERGALGAAEDAPELEAMERASEQMRAAMERAQVAVGAASERARRLGELLEQVERGGAERAEKEAALARVRRVADLANGRAGDKVRLSRFVLLDQFDRVVEAASARLDLMSDGRFRLRRRESRTVGREFDLLVDDAYTGAAERSVETLSGGEMFLASLAMALGLSDVVQQHAGGVRIESLFVDEGFGSLDEESLDKAVMVLEQLQAHQRLVGVVSHVPELRKRIPSRLEVVRTDAGSITRASARHHGK